MARIIINPQVFKDSRDAMCVAFDEAFRILMEYMDFECVSEPTDEQRRFFADTAYADDEVQLRRTILARICTLDTSVKDPTDEQLQEAVEFLDSVMESGAPQNEWEQRSVQRLRDVVAAIPPAGKAPPASGMDVGPEGDSGAQVQAAIGGGETDDEERASEQATAEKEPELTEGKDLNGDGSVIDHSKDMEVAGMDPNDVAKDGSVETSDVAKDGGMETSNEPTKLDEEPTQADGLTIHIGATVGISDSGGTGGNRQQKRKPGKGTIEAGLHADNPANRLEGGTHTRDGMSGSIGTGLHADNPANRLEGGTHTRDGMSGSIGAGLHADNPANRLEGGTHTRDGMSGAINKPITTDAEMGPKVSEEGRIDKPIKKDKTRI